MKAIKRRYQFPDGSNYPIVEASSGMILLVTQEDVVHAERHSPENCALAQCAVRIGATKAFIAGTIAYVVMPYKGRDVAMKFSVPIPTQRAIKHFDETGECPAEGFVLSKLHKGDNAASKKAWNDGRSPEQRRWTKKRGEVGDRQLRTYRHLTGQVHTKAE